LCPHSIADYANLTPLIFFLTITLSCKFFARLKFSSGNTTQKFNIGQLGMIFLQTKIEMQ